MELERANVPVDEKETQPGERAVIIEMATQNRQYTHSKAEKTITSELDEKEVLHSKRLYWIGRRTQETIYQQGAVSFIPLSHSPGRAYRVAKRCFDFLSSMVVSIVLLPVVLILMALIVIKDPGKPLYFQKRVGKGGRPIYVAKLRTMKKSSDHLEEMLTPDQFEEYKREYKLKDDPRLIGWKKAGDGRRCFGAILRKFSLDELPQITYNIFLKGDMSVVGPRPILEEELNAEYTPLQQQQILMLKPGLTGYWQAYARGNATYESGERQRMELYYAQNCSIRLDIRILFHTIKAVFTGQGAF